MPNQYLLSLFIVSALSSVVSAQTSDAAIPLSSTVVDLPMRFRGPEPAVEVMVNGQGPFLFAIDTGATDQARIDSSLLERLGLRVSGSDRVGDGSGGTSLKVGTVRLDSIAIGALEFRRVKASTRDFNTVGLPHIDGLLTFDPQVTFPTPFSFANIGSRILDQFAVTFDQKRDRIRFVRHNVDENN